MKKIIEILHRINIFQAVVKTVAILLSYLCGSLLTVHIHAATAYLGAILACTSTVVVLQSEKLEDSYKIGWLRVLGTFIGALMAVAYLSFFRFSVIGLVISIFLLDLICMVLKIPDNGKIATITLIVILIVSKTSPNLPPLTNGLLRFVESGIGTSIGIGMVWLINYLNTHFVKQKDNTLSSNNK